MSSLALDTSMPMKRENFGLQSLKLLLIVPLFILQIVNVRGRPVPATHQAINKFVLKITMSTNFRFDCLSDRLRPFRKTDAPVL